LRCSVFDPGAFFSLLFYESVYLKCSLFFPFPFFLLGSYLNTLSLVFALPYQCPWLILLFFITVYQPPQHEDGDFPPLLASFPQRQIWLVGNPFACASLDGFFLVTFNKQGSSFLPVLVILALWGRLPPCYFLLPKGAKAL